LTRAADIRATKRACTLALALAAAGGCGNLDNVTTVKDLRVLGARSDPAGFLVPLDDPSSLGDTQATVTALVVDPKGNAATLTFGGQACPDDIDTITAASGKQTTLCPPSIAQDLPNGSATPAAPSTIEYHPTTVLQIPATELELAFAPPTPAMPVVPAAVQYDRDFGIDAIVDLNFALGIETASLIKRVVYWPELPAALLPAGTSCPIPQVVNQNPTLTTVDFFRHRVEGEPQDPWTDAAPALSLAAGDALYVQPTYDPASAEFYFLRVNNAATGMVETQCRHELLTFQFYATAGTFSPAERASDLSPLFTSEDGKVHTDSQWNPPAAADLPADGKVTIWVVVHDERAGQSWQSRDLVITP
jgi:hypothetical protein